ncbi:SDR family NAD(P)-dependent oxidoreductase [Nonomuraea spiralis]|uniref:SDR family NAD(P)-dependent oxidoreductase n=1 Tax=Nonomuraea spiralis TaxID=46182 RepID=A0ABV5IXZ2_9ACTN|nr:SDR family NAD(P)-dependent oxidoreductase [Nonomuraea spiralis]GGS89554.1 oxidoreductase [Nonomuraea spiralis]
MSPTRRFEGRHALVTGAGSGIGLEIAARLAAEGAHVTVADRDAGLADRAAAEIGGTALHLDVTDAEAVAAIDLTPGVPDILVNNAAVCSDTPLPRMSEQEWDTDLATVLKGPFLVCRTLLPRMAARGSGSVVNIGSINASAYYGNDAYSAAKAGLESLTRSLAVRYGRAGVRVNLVAPATIRTPIWNERLARDPALMERLARWYPLGRIGSPEDVANAVLFLASAEAAWITGTVLRVDGGLSAGNAQLVTDILTEDYLA